MKQISDEKEQLWYWQYESDGQKHSLFMDIGEKIRFKVKEKLFVDTSPAGPTAATTSSDGNTLSENKRKIPFLIHVFLIWFQFSI